MIFNIKLVLPFDSNNELPYGTQTASSNIHMIKALCEDSRVISNSSFPTHYSSHKSFSTNHPFHRVVNRQESLKRVREGRKEEETAS